MPFILHTWMKIFSVKLLKSPFSQKFNDAKISWYTVFWADSIQFYFLNPHGLIKEKIGFEKEQNLQNRNSHTHQIGVQAFCRNLQAQTLSLVLQYQLYYHQYGENSTIINTHVLYMQGGRGRKCKQRQQLRHTTGNACNTNNIHEAITSANPQAQTDIVGYINSGISLHLQSNHCRFY